MIEQELHDFIQQIQTRGCEGQTTEVKAAHRCVVIFRTINICHRPALYSLLYNAGRYISGAVSF